MQNSNAKVYEVRILVNEFDSILRPAMTTKNTIVTAVIDSVLFIPIEAIFSNDSMTYVFKKDGGSIIKQQVIPGQSNENEIIIHAGLAEDDDVYLVQPDKPDDLKLITLSKEIIEKYKPKPSAKKEKQGKGQDSLQPKNPPPGNMQIRNKGIKPGKH
jgi:hypothetical protein